MVKCVIGQINTNGDFFKIKAITKYAEIFSIVVSDS